MTRISQVLAFELRKAVHTKRFWAALVVPAFLAVLSVAAVEAGRAREALDDPNFIGITSAYMSFSRGLSNGLMLGGFLLLFLAAVTMSNEGNWRTFKTIILRPHSRLEWILAKFTLLALLALGVIASVTAAAFLTASLMGDFGDVAEEGYVIFEASYMFRSTLLALGLALPALLALAAFGLMVSTMTDHPGAATSGALGAYIFLEAAKSALPEGRPFLFNAFAPSMVDTSYMQALRGFSEGMSDTGWETQQFYFNLATPTISALVFLLIAALIFSRRDFLI